MDSKGISYRDVNVETSDGQAEYQAQGGDGAVPLIVVGNHKMRGFNAEELEASL
jgi:glutaredoxin